MNRVRTLRRDQLSERLAWTVNVKNKKIVEVDSETPLPPLPQATPTPKHQPKQVDLSTLPQPPAPEPAPLDGCCSCCCPKSPNTQTNNSANPSTKTSAETSLYNSASSSFIEAACARQHGYSESWSKHQVSSMLQERNENERKLL